MKCTHATRLLSARLDRAIRPDDDARLAAHLSECPACRETAEVLRQQDGALRHAQRSCRDSSEAVAAAVIARLRAGRRARRRERVICAGMSAAVLVGVVVLWWLARPGPDLPATSESGVTVAVSAAGHADYLVPAPRGPAPVAESLAVGGVARTGPRERRRLALPDGSSLYLNENTAVRLETPRTLELTAGETYVEAAGTSDGPLIVRTPDRTTSGGATRFAVRVGPAGTGVVVARGPVRVSGVPRPLRAGDQLVPDGRLVPAPRTALALAWARDLIATADAPLGATPTARGALVVVDPDGREESLSLRKHHVDVHVEDGFARTTIDQTYFNHHGARLEGVFLFPLPGDASLSRLAMYVDGTRNEGAMVERDFGRKVYDSIVSRAQDPALLEWVDGTTFRLRVFPLEGRQEKRIILSYTQRLPNLHGVSTYRFPSGHSLGSVRDWSFHARIKGGSGLAWHSHSHDLREPRRDGDLFLDAAARDVRLDRDLIFELHDPAAPVGELARFTAHDQADGRYLLLRYRPELIPQSASLQPQSAKHWVFLFESSGERTPLLARAQVEVVRTMLSQAEPGDTFAVLTTGTPVGQVANLPKPTLARQVANLPESTLGRQVSNLPHATHGVGRVANLPSGPVEPAGRPGKLDGSTLVRQVSNLPHATRVGAYGNAHALPATAENVQGAIDFLERTHLVGALHLTQALKEAEPYLRAGKNAHLVYVGSGRAGMGERDPVKLAALIPADVRYVGIPVGRP